ncbi:MAG: hypothetical protein ACWA5X_01185 [bacterium]
MKPILPVFALLTLLLPFTGGAETQADDDTRAFVELPEMMQHHMMSNMRGHLESINDILASLSNEKFDQAAEIAETRLGMSSLTSHGASHMAKFMPQGMREAGMNMHKAASRFAKRAQEGEAPAAYKALTEVTAACVACHSAYRIH